MNDQLRNLNQEQQETMDGSPACVRDAAGYINIKFQCGPVQEHSVNGTSIENVLELLIRRLEGYQNGPFACSENAAALNHLRDAVNALEVRTKKRVAAGVEGTNQTH